MDLVYHYFITSSSFHPLSVSQRSAVNSQKLLFCTGEGCISGGEEYFACRPLSEQAASKALPEQQNGLSRSCRVETASSSECTPELQCRHWLLPSKLRLLQKGKDRLSSCQTQEDTSWTTRRVVQSPNWNLSHYINLVSQPHSTN